MKFKDRLPYLCPQHGSPLLPATGTSRGVSREVQNGAGSSKGHAIIKQKKQAKEKKIFFLKVKGLDLQSTT